MKTNEPARLNGDPMRALVQCSRQGPIDLSLATDRCPPTPGPEEYLVRVSAAGVNFADVMQTRGTYGSGPKAPYVAGFEGAGEIVEIGTGVVDGLPLGTHVVGAGSGAFAQYMTMPAAGVLSVPIGWRDSGALGMVLNWATALAALKPLGGIRTGDIVLIHAAAGGVGQAAVRLARHYGARVIATASPVKHDAVRALGAHEVLSSHDPAMADKINRLTCGVGVDLVLESVGKATLASSLAVAKPFSGTVVVFGAASGDATLTTHDLVFTHHAAIKGLHIGAFATVAPGQYKLLLTELDALIAQGVYPEGNPQVHPLAEGPEVLRQVEAGLTHGKHALDPWS
ncbi:zinc-binding dehydrogenase [Flexivirga meconopsidis]|uniref:zinc-binding dehydrogenase n=1 Tax=Flexivirga meconopsidis TaxID=2977121 RepID=UPI0022400E70|nr:zinc-binding dehydrogenase [Flexivirga meconopsidis]